MYKFPHLRLPIKGAYFLVVLSFLISLASAFVSPVFPLYIKSLVNNEAKVGFVVSIVAFLLLLSNFVVSKYLDLYKKKSLLIIGLIGCIITIILMGFVKVLYIFFILEIFRSFFLISVYITLALYIKDYSPVGSIGSIQGMHFAFANIAWLVGPLIGGLVAEKYTIGSIFIISSVFLFGALLLLLINPLKEEYLRINNNSHTFKNIKNFFKSKDLTLIYLSSIGLMMWWVMIYTFTPLFIKDVGLSTRVIGYVLFAVAIPLIILEIPLGRLADKTGFKKYFFLGFIIMGVSAILTYFFSINLALLFIILASIGAAFLEPLREAYLFRKLKHSQLKYEYPVYRTAVDIGQILGPVIFSTVLLYTNFRFLYLFAGILMLLFGFVMLGLKDIRK